jgi:choline kinase
MQAVILAAGIAKRLRPLTESTPKCLLKIGNKNLLQRTMENILANDIKDFIFVTGYREDMIKKYLNENFNNLNIEFITNPDYENNNNSYSLWMTKNYVKDEMLLLDSDILFDKNIIKELLNSGKENCLAVNITHDLDAEQIKVTANEDYKILKIGKDVEINKAIGESIGIEKFNRNYLIELFNILDRKIIIERNVNEFYEVSFQEIMEKNDARNSLFGVDVSNYDCMEIDTIDDYNKANELFLKINY